MSGEVEFRVLGVAARIDDIHDAPAQDLANAIRLREIGMVRDPTLLLVGGPGAFQVTSAALR